MNKSALFSLLTSTALIAMPMVASAQVNSTSVVNSGDHANVNSATSQTSSTNVSNSNYANVDQFVNAHANTGGNSANGNIALNGGAASIVTGAAGVSTTMGVAANNNATIIGGTAPASSNLTDVVNTGDHASVNTNTSTDTAVNVANVNKAHVSQSCGGGFEALFFDHHNGGCDANTGNNDANNNIGGGSITTGAAAVGANFGVDVNHNTTGVGGGVGEGIANAASIINTGDHASVDANAQSSSSVGVSNSNYASIWQSLHGNANTGHNDANSNIGGGSVTTSGAGVGAAFGVNANSNVTGVGSSLELMNLGGNLTDVVNTGDDFASSTGVNTSTSVNVANADSLFSEQSVWSHSSSGWNETDSNIGSAHVGTGLAGVGATFGLMGNTNATAIGGVLGSLVNLVNWL
jgi:hypothetical protein